MNTIASSGFPWLRIVLMAACCLGVGVEQANANPMEQPPNVVLILVDDLGWTDLSCQGSRYYETPHIDRMAREGMPALVANQALGEQVWRLSADC